jgi:hypothetical protein
MSIHIGRNDATLAHALAKSVAAGQLARDMVQLQDKAETHFNKRTMKGAFRVLRGIFRDRVIHEVIVREKGSRACGHLFILQPVSSGAMVLFLLSWVKGRVRQHDTPVVVSHHALARMMQRTVGESDLAACCERIKPYVLTGAAASISTGPEDTTGMQLTVAGNGGALIFRREGDMVVAATWMDSEMMADPKLRAAAVKPNLTTWWE